MMRAQLPLQKRLAPGDSRRALARPTWRRLFAGDQGAISIVFVFMVTMVIGVFLCGFDFMDEVMAKSRDQMAVDAASLSSGADLVHYTSTTGASLTQWQADALAYYQANMPSTYIMGGPDLSAFSATVSGSVATGQTVVLNSGVKLTLLSALWNNASKSGSGSGSGSGTGSGTTTPTVQTVSAGATVTRITQGTLELVMVLDNTGSMADAAGSGQTGSKIQGLQAAATTLVNDVFAQTGTTSYIGLVPFANMVNVSGALPPGGSWLNPSFAYNSKGVSMSYVDSTHPGWGGCTVEPHDANGNVYPEAYSPSDTMKFTPFYYNTPPSGLTLDTFTSSTNRNNCKAASSTTFLSVPLTTNVSMGSLLSNQCNATIKGQGVPTELSQVTSSQSTYTVNQNNNCVASSSNTNHILPVTFLTTNKQTLLNSINLMQASGSTIIPVGLLWGWRMLSSSWSNNVLSSLSTSSNTPAYANSGWISSDGSLPKPEATQGLRRVIVVLTDGQNQIGSQNQFINDIYFNGLSGVASRTLSAPTVFRTDGSSLANGLTDSSELYGGNPYSNGSGNPDDINTFQQGVCSAIKNAGITVFSITFGSDASSSSAQQNMLNCATPGNYYHAPDSATLNSIFSNIASQIGELRITQ